MARGTSNWSSDAPLWLVLAVVLGGLSALFSALVSQPEGEAAGGTGERLDAPAYRLDLAPDLTLVRLTGRIDFGIARDLAAMLEGAADVRILTLESPGGRVAEARGLIGVIERFGLETAAVGVCASACALVFMSGQTRYLEPGARLGFHRYGLFSPLVGHFMDPEVELAKDMAVFRRHAVPEAFIERIALTPHEAMWFPSPAELVRARVVDVVGRPD